MIVDLRKNPSIPSLVSQKTIQKECIPILQEITSALKKEYEKNIYSIYLYGSFSRGDGVFKKSDLDLFVITNGKIEFREREKQLNEKYKDYFIDTNLLSKEYNEVRKDTYGWMAFLKLFCVCVEGEDLTNKNKEYKVTNNLIKGFIEDEEVLLLGYKRGDSPQRREKISKLIIRSIYYASLDKHLQWTTVLKEQILVLKKQFPEYQKRIDILEQVIKDSALFSDKQLEEAAKPLQKVILRRAKELKD